MNIQQIPSLLGGIATILLGALIFAKNPRHLYNRTFTLCAFSVFLVELGTFMIFSVSPEKRLFWGRFALVGLCLLPANGTLFSLVFWRENYSSLLKRWRWRVVLLYVASLMFLAYIPSHQFLDLVDNGVLVIGKAGYYFHIFFLLSLVIGLINLENTLKNASDDTQKQIQYPLLGLMGVFLFGIYAASQMILLRRVSLVLLQIGSVMILLANVLIFLYVIRRRVKDSQVLIGREVIYSSAMVIMVGLYLLMVGGIAKLILWAGGNLDIFFSMLAAFAALFLLMFLFLSQSLKNRIRGFIDRNFHPVTYDYREELSKFTESISSILDLEELTSTIVDTVVGLVSVRKVALLLPQGFDNHFVPLKIKGLPEVNGLDIPSDGELSDWLWRWGKPVDLEKFSRDRSFSHLYQRYQKIFEALEIRVCVPMITKRKLVGLLTLGEKSSGQGYTDEELDLLETIANQSSVAILNAILSEELLISKELESFHRISSFVLHDLKNSVSMLSMVVKNAQIHLNNPEFQRSMLTTLSTAVEKMKNLMNKMSTLPAVLTLNPHPTNIEKLVEEAIERANISEMKDVKIVERLEEVPRLMVDPEHIRMVITNLIVNALEAMPHGGVLTISTRLEPSEEMGIVEISDTGVGMPPDYIRHRLFKPFQTTKAKGLGIGLYQCREIIDAHGGKISVRSVEGQGTTFILHLPIAHQRLKSEGIEVALKSELAVGQ